MTAKQQFQRLTGVVLVVYGFTLGWLTRDRAQAPAAVALAAPKPEEGT